MRIGEGASETRRKEAHREEMIGKDTRWYLED